MANWRDRDYDWRSRRSFDEWRDWRERDRGMEGPRAYGASMRNDEYAGFPHGEQISRRDWARDYMPDRGYSAYGGDYRRRETGYARGYPDDYRSDSRAGYGRDSGRAYEPDDWRDRSRFARDDDPRSLRERIHDAGDRMRERYRGEPDYRDDRFREEGDRDRDRGYGRYGSERPWERYGYDDVESRLRTPDHPDDPWNRYPEGRRDFISSDRWNEDRDRWRKR